MGGKLARVVNPCYTHYTQRLISRKDGPSQSLRSQVHKHAGVKEELAHQAATPALPQPPQLEARLDGGALQLLENEQREPDEITDYGAGQQAASQTAQEQAAETTADASATE